MAKLLFGTIVTALSGSVGGNVFSRGINGAYLKRKGKTVNRNTVAQNPFRNSFGSINRSWRSLSSTDKATWVAGAINFPYTNSLGAYLVIIAVFNYFQS